MLHTGETFAGYTIERLLGRGGMGSVYLARHPRLPRLTAMKLLNPELFDDKEVRTRFEREADLVARLDHPNIVTVFDRGVEDERLWISMQYIDGTDATAVDATTSPPSRAVRIIAETAKALDFAHRNGVLHRDVKPANILLEGNGGPDQRVFLTDFGIARLRDDTGGLTQTGTFTATLAYASPEQLSGAVLDHRSDQYSLACTLFRLLTGTVPFDATNPAAVIQAHLMSPPPPVSRLRPGLPAALDAVLAKAMAKRAGERFGSCTEFADAASRALTARPQAATGQFAPPPFPTPMPPRPTPAQPLLPRHPRDAESAETGPTFDSRRPDPGRRSRRRLPVGAVVGVCLTVGLVGSIVAFALAGTDAPSATPPTSTTRALTTTATRTAPNSTAPSATTAPPTTADRAVVGANAAKLSSEFPGMLPKTTAQQLVQSGSGYNKAGCFAYQPSDAITEHDDPTFGTWLVMWRCFGGPNKAAFAFYLHASPADAQAALDGLPANDRSTATNHGREYTNYTLRDSNRLRPRMATAFTADPQRASILMYSAGFIATDAEFMQWWTDAPLN